MNEINKHESWFARVSAWLEPLRAKESALNDTTTTQRRTCRTCLKEFAITQGQLEWLQQNGLGAFSHCKPCRQQRASGAYDETIAEHRVCRLCDAEFSISVGELAWLKLHGFPVFTHCKSCRAKRRDLRRKQEAA